MSKLKILILGLPLLLAWMASSAQPQHKFAVYTTPVSGQPHILLSRGKKIVLKSSRKRLMRPGDRIITSRRSQALLHFSRGPACRLRLEPNSALQLVGPKPGNVYSMKLSKGAVKCAGASCRMRLSVVTPTGMLRGKDVEFTLRVYRHATTVILKSGLMRLFVRGQSVKLPAMTRTIVSQTGEHRISTMYGSDFTRDYRMRTLPSLR